MDDDKLLLHQRLHAALKVIHDRLEDDLQTVISLSYTTRTNPILLRTDSAFALGQLCGTLSKARALIGRDIDDNA